MQKCPTPSHHYNEMQTTLNTGGFPGLAEAFNQSCHGCEEGVYCGILRTIQHMYRTSTAV